MNNSQTLVSEIKFSFRSANIPLIIFGSIFISLMGHFMVLGHNPELINDPLEIHVIFVLFMAFFIGLSLSVALVFLGASLYCKPKVMQYVNVPKDIEDVRDGLIALGSYITSLDKTIVPTGLSSIFYYIIKQLKKLDVLQSNVEKLESEIKQLKEDRILDMKEYQKVNNKLAEEKIAKAILSKENKSKELDIQKAFNRIHKLEEELEKLKGG